VSNEHIGDIDSIGSLSGRTICVREGSSYHLSLLELNKRLTDASRQPVDIVALPGVVETGDILEMVSADVVQMTVANSHIAGIAGKVLPNLKIHDHLVLNEDVRYGWMVRKSNPRLRESLNGFIQTIKKGTLKGNIYFERYFNENPWGRVALKREDFDMCCQFVPLFRKYGELYGIDWMLLAAQAYQESRFDPEAVSPDGAMGLMQLLPKTAREMGIENILHPEDNIHAAVRYLKWIMDHYFTRPEISSDDRVRFALAAYNAGPKKIRKARRVTATMGYDSSKWFGNAELGTLRHVGPEPVQYVRSVNKNYLAFLLSKVTGDIKQQRLDESISLSDRGEEDE
jgi:membrane-bound lytic murein transglycosylase MltF